MTIGVAESKEQVVATIVKGVVKKTAMTATVIALAAAVYTILVKEDPRWWFLPGGILFGGVLGLLNFRWLAIAVERVYLRQGATPVGSNLAAVIISVLKLSLIFVVLFIVIKWRLLHVFGLVGGLSLCFLAILWEGMAMIKNIPHHNGA